MPKYKITNNQTGETLVVSGNKAPSQSDVQDIFASRTPQTQDTKTWSQKLQNIPIIGDISGTVTTAGTGLGALLTQGTINKRTSQDQTKALELAKQAQTEKDPIKKQQLLEQSRQLSQGAGELSTKQYETVRSGVGNFADKESPTNLVESLKTYGPQAVRTGVTVGSLVAPMLAGANLTGFAPTVAGRIAGAGTQGALMGGIYGLAQQDEATATQRLEDSLVGAGTGAVVGTALQGLIETAGGIKNALTKLSSKASTKLRDLYKSTLKQNIRDQKFYQQYGGEDKLVDDAIRYDIPSTKDGVKKELDRFSPEYNRLVKEKSALADKSGKKVNIRKAYETAKSNVLRELKDDDEMLSGAKSYFDKNDIRFLNKSNETARPISANKLRVRLDKKTGALITSDIDSGRTFAKKKFASELRLAFKEAVPELKPYIKKYQLLSGLSEAMQKEPVIGITETAMAAASPGKGIWNIPEFLLGKAIRSPGVKRAIAKTGTSTISNISKSGLESMSRNVVSPFRTEALRNALNQSISKNKNNVFSNF